MRKILLRIASITVFLFLILFVITVKAPLKGLHAQSGHSITLSWSQAATGTQPTGFNLKRSTTSGTEVTVTTVPFVVGTSSYSFIDTGIGGGGVAGQTYFYVVTATNPNANPPETAPSNEVSATFLPLAGMAVPVVSPAVAK